MQARCQYSRYLILSLISGHSTQLLKEKCELKGIETDVIQLEFDDTGTVLPLSSEDKSKIKKLRDVSCIYVHGHGDRGMGMLVNEKSQTITFQQLAEMIATNLIKENIVKLRIKVFACFAGASLVNKDSFAESLLKQFGLYRMRNVELIASPDMVAIRKHPISSRIFCHRETEIENNIRERYKVKRLELLDQIKSDFVWGHLSLDLPYEVENLISYYASINLTPEKLMDRKKIEEFIAELCTFLLTQLYAKQPVIYLLVPLVLALMIIKERLVALSSKMQHIELDKAMAQIKHANYSRPNAKILFKWSGEEVQLSDYYEKKRLAGHVFK